jgi:hypothetical protein
MKYAILALGLLVTPAQAAKLDTETCARIEYIFDACSVSEKQPQCYLVHEEGRGRGESKDLSQFSHSHPKLDWKKLYALCDQLCNGNKTTVLKATREFCPRYRPQP